MAQLNLPDAALNIPGVSEQTPVERLHGGLSNSSWRIRIGNDAFAVRQGSQSRREILREVDVWQSAAARGLAPELYYVDADNGLIVSAWAQGLTGSGEDLSHQNLHLLGRALARLHELVYPAETLDLVQRAQAYCQMLVGPSLVQGKTWLKELECLLRDLDSRDLRLCHNDLVAENMIFGTQLVFVDWEYGMANDPFFDLAVVCAHHELDESAARVLLEGYCGHSDATLRQRLASWQQVYLRVYALWLMATQEEQGATTVAQLRERLR